MNPIILVAILVGLVSCESSITLNDGNFESTISSGSYVVLFSNDNTLESFNSFFEKVSALYNDDQNSALKFARVDCTIEKRICESENITKVLELKLFSKGYVQMKWKQMIEYIEKAIKEALEGRAIWDAIQVGTHLVEFYSSYCSHCEEFAPIWKKIEANNEDNPSVALSKCDCEVHKWICKKFGVRRYPSIMWLEDGKAIERYPGGRNQETIQEYIDEKFPKSVVKREAELEKPAMTDFNSTNFHEGIANGSWFILYHMLSCIHCREIRKQWTPISERYATNEKINIGRVECSENSQLCREEARGSPTLNAYQDGKRVKKDYHEDMSDEGLIEWIEAYAHGGERLAQWTEKMKQMRKERKEREKKEDEEAAKAKA